MRRRLRRVSGVTWAGWLWIASIRVLQKFGVLMDTPTVNVPMAMFVTIARWRSSGVTHFVWPVGQKFRQEAFETLVVESQS